MKNRFLSVESIIIGVIGIAMALYFLGVFDSKSGSNDQQQQHPTGNPRQDAEIYNKFVNQGDVDGALLFLDEVNDFYMQDFVNDRGKKLDEFYEWNGKLMKNRR